MSNIVNVRKTAPNTVIATLHRSDNETTLIRFVIPRRSTGVDLGTMVWHVNITNPEGVADVYIPSERTLTDDSVVLEWKPNNAVATAEAGLTEVQLECFSNEGRPAIWQSEVYHLEVLEALSPQAEGEELSLEQLQMEIVTINLQMHNMSVHVNLLQDQFERMADDRDIALGQLLPEMELNSKGFDVHAETFFTMPDNSYISLSGAQLNTLLNSALGFQLPGNVTYILSKRRISLLHKVYTIQRISGRDLYWGYEVPTRPGEITWVTLAAGQDVLGMESGGRNLLYGTAFDSALSGTGWSTRRNATIAIASEKYRGHGVLELKGNSNQGDLFSNMLGYKPSGSYFDGGEIITLSFAAKSSAVQNMKVRFGLASENQHFTVSTQWSRYEIHMPTAQSGWNVNLIWVTDNPDAVLYLSEVKAEFGSHATPWSPAPDDVGGETVKLQRVPKHYDHVLITEMEHIHGKWSSFSDSFDYEAGFHSQLIPVVGGRSYYMAINTGGAMFNEHGQWIDVVLSRNSLTHSYESGDIYNQYTPKVPMYMFTVPDGVRYISLNLPGGADSYLQYISSEPVFMVANMGNYMWNDSDPAYQAKKDKKLCIIGASGVALNRGFDSALGQYTAGFQEYLVPWYKQVDSYGYSGTPWGDYGSGIKLPICHQMADIPLGMYDEFLLNVSTNGMGEDSKRIGSYSDTTLTTYCGAINYALTQIYAAAPNAKVYIANLMHKSGYYASEQIAKLAEHQSLHLLDIAGDSGVNEFNNAAGKMTSDDTHLNQYGSRAMGLALRKRMIGF